MPSTRSVPPSAPALIGSLRGVGYSLETATADIIDNSIAAQAEKIDITWDWNGGNPIAAILDDGYGMSDARMVEAMRFGGVGPQAPRSEDDLGRFGLGLKTASLSQCRRLSVASKMEQGLAAFTWDVDHVLGRDGGWDLLEGLQDIPEPLLKRLEQRSTGTLVVWQKVDFGRQDDRPDYHSFLADLERVEWHLGMVFHRFLAGDARRVAIALNGHTIEAWDPFLETHEATERRPEQPIAGPGGRVRVRGFVLPHPDRFASETELTRAGGPDGWTAHQGFYVYRHKRLLSAGGWLGLGGSRAWTRDEASRLARIRIDIPGTADREWRIDIRKALARPPDSIRKPLQRIAEDIRRRAREVFVHRGRYGPRAQSTPLSRVWKVNPEGARRRYAIDRDHTLVVLVRERLPEHERDLLDALLDHIERTVPVDRVWLDVTERGLPMEVNEPSELVSAAVSLAQLLERSGLSLSEAVARVVGMDPFDRIEGLAELILRHGRRR